MNMIWSSIKVAGHACAYIKNLTNFQNENSHTTPESQKNKKKKEGKKKDLRNSEILLPTISLKISLKIA